jgi:hypothetical protein
LLAGRSVDPDRLDPYYLKRARRSRLVQLRRPIDLLEKKP